MNFFNYLKNTDTVATLSISLNRPILKRQHKNMTKDASCPVP